MSQITIHDVIQSSVIAPPGITHPLLVEKYDWVDQRLEELYHGYSLTADNCDEFQDAGLLREKWAWIDNSLHKNYYASRESGNNYNNYDLLMPAPISWANYHSTAIHECIEDDSGSSLGKRKRSESVEYDSDYDSENLWRVDSELEEVDYYPPRDPGKYTFVPLSDVLYGLDCQRHNYEKSFETGSFSSLELDSDNDSIENEYSNSIDKDVMHSLDKDFQKIQSEGYVWHEDDEDYGYDEDEDNQYNYDCYTRNYYGYESEESYRLYYDSD